MSLLRGGTLGLPALVQRKREEEISWEIPRTRERNNNKGWSPVHNFNHQ
jgi:hypothetical protein